jgi:hypothetical protein
LETLKGKVFFEDLVVDRMIIKWIERNMCGDVDWICLIQDWSQWRDFMSVVVNFLFHKDGEFPG